MKSVCMEDRYKTKDAYDLYYTIRHYPGGIAAVIAALEPDLANGLVKEALGKIDLPLQIHPARRHRKLS